MSPVSLQTPFSGIPFRSPCITGKFICRTKRFLAEVWLPSGEKTVAHVPNPGSMKSCLYPDHPCLLSHTNAPHRKLAYTMEAIYGETTWIGTNTHNANHIAYTFLSQRFTNIRKEPRLTPHWRPDFLVTIPEIAQDAIIEVKSVTLSYGNTASFPDAITTRGQTHLKNLLAQHNKGHCCGLLFVVQRSDVSAFHPAHWIDKAFSELFWSCLKAGIWIWIQKIEVTPEGFWDRGCLPLLGHFAP